jgi:halogenation protein CepH
MGGGPGGSSAATFLAQKGYRVLLLEREKFPRFHIGESLLPGNWDLWDKLGVTAEIEAAGFTIKQGINFRLFDGPRDFIFLTGEYPQYFQRPYTFHVERAEFDLILLNNTRRHGVDVREEWTVKDVIVENGQVVGVLAGPNGKEPAPYYSRVVVDATGRNCMLAKKFGRTRTDPELNKISHFTHFTGAKRRDNGDGSTMLDVHTVEGGWLWYIPMARDLVSVGIVLDAKAAGPMKGPQARLEQAIESCPVVKEWLQGAQQKMEVHTISSISYQNDSFVGDGFVLVGDASMFVDPIFSSGVLLAMRGAFFAVEAIHEAFQANDFSAAAFDSYEQRIRRPMKRIFKMIYNWYKILDSKDPNNLFALAQRFPFLREKLIVLFSGGYDREELDSLADPSDPTNVVPLTRESQHSFRV